MLTVFVETKSSDNSNLQVLLTFYSILLHYSKKCSCSGTFHPYLVYVSPVPVILKAFPKHCHDFIAGNHVVGQIRDICHLRTGWAPRVIGRCLPHLHWDQRMKCGWGKMSVSLLPARIRVISGATDDSWFKISKHEDFFSVVSPLWMSDLN